MFRNEAQQRLALFVAAALMSTGPFADDAGVQRAKALGAYIDSYTGTAGLLATECKALAKEPLKTPQTLLDEERPFLCDLEYQEFKADLESNEYKEQMAVMVETLRSGVAAGVKGGTGHRRSCSIVVGAMEAQVKQQKDAWNALKRAR